MYFNNSHPLPENKSFSYSSVIVIAVAIFFNSPTHLLPQSFVFFLKFGSISDFR
jgi:hypothetical protein